MTAQPTNISGPVIVGMPSEFEINYRGGPLSAFAWCADDLNSECLSTVVHLDPDFMTDFFHMHVNASQSTVEGVHTR